MTLGTITLPEDNLKGAQPSAPLFAINVSFPGDDSYTTNGTVDFQVSVREAIEAHMAALPDANVRGRSNVTILTVVSGDCGIWEVTYDKANDLLKAWVKATGVETANAVAMNGTVFNLTLICN